MKRLFVLVALIAAACSGQPGGSAGAPASYRLYDGPAPGSETWDWEEYTYTDPAGDSYFTNIKDPEIVAYLPPADRATGAAMIVCPGGGFTVNYYTKEGSNVAEWLSAHGVAAFVLKYRQRGSVLFDHRGAGAGVHPGRAGRAGGAPARGARARQ